MRILVIGDIHGHKAWEKIVLKEDYDRVVFLGDYFDNYRNTPGKEQVTNFREILSMKGTHPDTVELLYGNHDHSYLNKEKCSGYKWQNQLIYEEVLKEAKDKGYLKPVLVLDDIIFSHAGVSSYWLKEVAGLDKPEEITFDTVPLDRFNFNYLTGYDVFGDTPSQSPIWIRPMSLLQFKVEGYRQVVGHTQMKKPVSRDGVWFNDMMPSHYIIIEDGEITFKENKYEVN